MKTAPFEYSRPNGVEEACALLARDEDARIIAGGQTLVPMMAMRLARPTLLIDISRIPDLAFVRDDGAHVSIGAATRQAAAERAAVVKNKLPLLAMALPWIGHDAIRNRGTIGGSLANADPAAEIGLALATLNGAIVFQTPEGKSELPVDDFFLGPMTTDLPADGVLIEARFPVWIHARIGAGFLEISARHGDFAYVSAAAQVALDDDGRCLACAIGIGGATPTPTRLNGASRALVGEAITEANARGAIDGDIENLDIMTDPYATPAYRRRVAKTLARRALLAACEQASSAGARR